jgi:hypothetical protein
MPQMLFDAMVSILFVEEFEIRLEGESKATLELDQLSLGEFPMFLNPLSIY